MSLQLIIDTREQRLASLLDVPFVIAPLEIGDIHLHYADETNPFTIVLERKSIRDLASSIKDGRYREQKVRMLSAYPAHYCTYLVENDQGLSTDVMNESCYHGAIMNTLYRDKIHVMILKNIQETARYVSILYKKVLENPSKFVATNTQGSEYIDHVKVKKRKMDNIDPGTCYLMQWCQIPGISQKIAKEIMARYPSWSAFYQAMAECATEQEKLKLLQGVPMLGAKKAATILQYLVHNNNI